MSLNFYTKEEENNKEESIDNYKYLFKDYEQKVPTLSDALFQMFKSSNLNDDLVEEFTEDILMKCQQKIDKNYDQIKQKHKNISKNDAYIICVYTLEAKDKKYSPYRILNQNLVANNRKNGIENISKYLYIFLNSLRKLPRYYPKNSKRCLYRCITHKVSLDEDPKNKKFVPYKEGNKKTFWGFTSTSSNSNAIYSFLKDEIMVRSGSKNEDEILLKSGTLFRLEGNAWGYDIALFNPYDEEEILLEPERKFIITEVLGKLNEVINVTCNIIETPLVLEIIGKGLNNADYGKENRKKLCKPNNFFISSNKMWLNKRRNDDNAIQINENSNKILIEEQEINWNNNLKWPNLKIKNIPKVENKEKNLLIYSPDAIKQKEGTIKFGRKPSVNDLSRGNMKSQIYKKNEEEFKKTKDKLTFTKAKNLSKKKI